MHLVAETPEQYIDIAARLADDLPRLKTLRRTLREMSIVNGLADSQQFARNLERAYTEMLGQVERQGYQLACHACGSGLGRGRMSPPDSRRLSKSTTETSAPFADASLDPRILCRAIGTPGPLRRAFVEGLPPPLHRAPHAFVERDF